MTLEEIQAKQTKAYAHLKYLEDGADYETMADAYEYAFDLIDGALSEAIKYLKEYRRVIYPSADRDILGPNGGTGLCQSE